MATEKDALRFIDVLRGDDQGMALITNLVDAVDLDLVSADDAAKYVFACTDWWLNETQQYPGSDEDPELAVLSARAAAGAGHGFPGRRGPINAVSEPTRYVACDLNSLRTYHFDVTALLSSTTVMLESCRPGEASGELAKLVRMLQVDTRSGQNFVRPGAQLGNPRGALWSTPSTIDPLEKPTTIAASSLRNRLGLPDSSWETGKGLFLYSLDADYVQPEYRPTPIEGGNRRFRVQPVQPREFHPFGATVDLELLERTVQDSHRVNDDGVPESASAPFQPDDELWKNIVRDMRCAGALSSEADLPSCSDKDFLDRILGTRSAESRVDLLRRYVRLDPGTRRD